MSSEYHGGLPAAVSVRRPFDHTTITEAGVPLRVQGRSRQMKNSRVILEGRVTQTDGAQEKKNRHESGTLTAQFLKFLGALDRRKIEGRVEVLVQLVKISQRAIKNLRKISKLAEIDYEISTI